MGVGFRIKQILRNRKMTIKQLSEKSGISVNTLYSITKRDSENVDPVIMQKIADTLDIPIYELDGYKLVHDTPENRAIAEAGFKAAFGRSSKNEHEIENISCTTNTDSENNYITVERDQMLHALETAFSILNEQGRKSVIEYAKILAGNPDYQNAVAEAILEVAEKTEKPPKDSTQPHDGK